MEKTTRPKSNQISYDYTMEVRNRFRGLDLIDRMPDDLWTEVCDIVQEVAQRVKHLPAMRETWVRSLGPEDPLEKEKAIHFSTIAWKTP